MTEIKEELSGEGCEEARPKRLVVALSRDEHRDIKQRALNRDITVMDMIREELFGKGHTVKEV